MENVIRKPLDKRVEKDEVNCALAKSLSAAMAKANISKQALSDKTGIPVSYISRIENGKANPSMRTLLKLADGLEMKLKLEFIPIVSKKPELCVVCGMQTEYFVSDPIQGRKNYVSGVGQLCRSCSAQIAPFCLGGTE